MSGDVKRASIAKEASEKIIELNGKVSLINFFFFF